MVLLVVTMRYCVNALSSDGCSVGVVVETHQAVLATVQAYTEDGFEEVTVHDQDGKAIQFSQICSAPVGSPGNDPAVDGKVL
jgi:hypothetical protein